MIDRGNVTLAVAQNLSDRQNYTDELNALQRHIFNFPEVLAIGVLDIQAD
jgi:hypothetical protein